MVQYSKEDIVRRGKAIYERLLAHRVSPADHGKFLAINIENETYAVDSDELAALKRAADSALDAPVYLMRIGYPTAHRLGGRVTVRQQ